MGSLFNSLRAVLVAALTVAPLAAAAEVALVMAEEDGCYWCAKWNEEVGGEYPITAEGRAAPLRRVDIHADIPPDLSFDDRLVYTPTFVLMQDGREVSRLEGYPGEDFFWPLLQQMLNNANIPWQEDQS